MVEEEKKRRKGAFSLVTRKSTKKMLGKWKKLESFDRDDGHTLSSSHCHPRPRLFGIPLQEACRLDPSVDDIALPAIVRQCVDYVNIHGLELEGIYRVSCPKSRLDELEREANLRALPIHFCHPTPTKHLFHDAHEAACLLKRYLRQLPHSLLPPGLEDVIDTCPCDWRTPCRCAVSKIVDTELRASSSTSRILLAYIFIHAQLVISKEASNKMGVPALGLLLQTILDMPRRAVCLLLSNATPALCGIVQGATFLFTDVQIKTYVPPKSVEEVESWICEDRPRIEEELQKQNNLLELLHDKVLSLSEVSDKTALESRLWGIQQAVTILRRRLRSVAEPTKAEESEEHERARPSIYEEKQLLAVQSSLYEDIVAEKKRIAELCWTMAKMGLDPVFEVFCQESDDEPPSKSSTSSSRETDGREEAILEAAARSSLVDEISKLRGDCAVMRARLELLQQDSPSNVTRF